MDLDFQKDTAGFDFADESPDSSRSKTSLRMHYEAQAGVIRHQIGDLEAIRLKLGLSQRKICQLLLVDPSAWTRWTKSAEKEGGSGAPPHVFRSLQWYLALQEKVPGLTNEYFLGSSHPKITELKRDIDELKSRTSSAEAEFALQKRVNSLEESLQSVKRLNVILSLTSLILILSLGFRLLFVS